MSNLRELVEAGLKWAQENNVKVIKNKYGYRDDNCGCALQCAYWAAGGTACSPCTEEFKEVLGLNELNAGRFMCGFDDGYNHRDNNPYHNLGAEFGARYE